MAGFDDGSDPKSTRPSWLPVPGLAAVLIVTVLIVISAGVYQMARVAGGYAGASTNTTTDTGASGTGSTGTGDNGSELQRLAGQIAGQSDRLNDLTRLRSDIIDRIIARSSELGLSIDIDKVTGSVRFSEALFFEKNSEQINATGEQYLIEFIPAYLSTVMTTAGAELDQIIIEGHADEDSTYLYNLNLSQRRAYSVAAFIFEHDLANIDGISNPEKLISISGRSYSVPVITDGSVDREKSRRVEFRFRLKDEDAINGLKALFDSFMLGRAGN